MSASRIVELALCAMVLSVGTCVCFSLFDGREEEDVYELDDDRR